MDPGTQGKRAHWSSFNGNTKKVAKILAKLKFTQEAAKSIVGDGLNIGEELEQLDDNICKIFLQNYCNPSAGQYRVVISMVDEVFLKFLIWGLQHMKCVSRTIGIVRIDIQWCHGTNNQKKLKADRPNNLLKKDYTKANLGDVTQTFEDIMTLLRNICSPSGIFLTYCVRELLVPLDYEYDKTNYPTKDEEMINNPPIVTLAATGTNTEKTKDGPFHKYFAVNMIFLWDIMHHIFGQTKFRVHEKMSAKTKNWHYALFLLKKPLLGLQDVTDTDDQLELKLRSSS